MGSLSADNLTNRRGYGIVELLRKQSCLEVFWRKAMSRTVHYDLNSPTAAVEALKDCKSWLGNAQFKKIAKLLASDAGQSSRYRVRLGLLMVGIQGYPAEKMIEAYWNPQRTLF